MSLHACLFGVIITLFQVGRNPTSGEWTFPFSILQSRTLAEGMNGVVPSFTGHIFLLLWHFMEMEQSKSVHLLFDCSHSDMLPFYRPDTLTSYYPQSQTSLPDRLMKYCCVLS